MQFKRNLCIVVFKLTQLFYLANTHAASYGSAGMKVIIEFCAKQFVRTMSMEVLNTENAG